MIECEHQKKNFKNPNFLNQNVFQVILSNFSFWGFLTATCLEIEVATFFSEILRTCIKFDLHNFAKIWMKKILPI